MNEKEINTAIANALGYSCTKHEAYDMFVIRHPSGAIIGNEVHEECFSDYHGKYYSDLNAMHAAEKVLTHRQIHDYSRNLFDLLIETQTNKLFRFQMFQATAAQRAEAFLKTLNLWK